MPRSALRVLIAEDNETNLDVCRHFLTQAGVTRVSAAGNGLEVLRLLEAAPDAYDFILMDVRMPEMDGIETTREILARWPDPSRRPRIIALTAHAFVEETRRCLEAGMDACLSKPLRRQDLESVLNRVFGPTAPLEPAEQSAPPAGPVSLIDWRQFDMIVDAPDSPCVGIFLKFVESVPPAISEISAAAGRGDADRTADLCHQLKGTGGSFGLARFTENIKAAERIARSGSGMETLAGEDWRRETLLLFSQSRNEIRAQRSV